MNQPGLIRETLTISGKGILQNGVARTGKEWKKLQVICEREPDRFGKTESVALTGFGVIADDLADLAVGDTINVEYVARSQEWKGRWFTDLVIVALDTPDVKAIPAAQEADEDNEDDMPF